MTCRIAAALVVALAAPAFAQQDATNLGAKLIADPAVKTALDAIKAAELQTIEDQVRICEVEAPPFKETKRADVYARMFREAGLQNVRIDKEGNVTNVKVLKGLPMGLEESAVDAIKTWRFKPATLNGKPVMVYYNLTVNFKLQ